MIFEITFNDLTKDAQEHLMESVGINDPSEMNWDIPGYPIAIIEIGEELDGE